MERIIDCSPSVAVQIGVFSPQTDTDMALAWLLRVYSSVTHIYIHGIWQTHLILTYISSVRQSWGLAREPISGSSVVYTQPSR